MDQLLAWIEPLGPHEFTAAFVSKAMASRRAPATQRFGSPDEAREWIKREAEALGVSVQWIDYSPQFTKDGLLYDLPNYPHSSRLSGRSRPAERPE